MTWHEIAACRDTDMRLFFDEVWPDEDEEKPDAAGLATARAVCARCPVRRACFKDIMDYEEGRPARWRWGVVAGLTPQQRAAVEKRGTITCRGCGAILDPFDVIEGKIICPRRECAINDDLGPVSEMGERWTKRHTFLARGVVGWMTANLEPGARMPRPAELNRQLTKAARLSDLTRVYQALTTDGTLTREGMEYTYVRFPGSAREWVPQHRRAA